MIEVLTVSVVLFGGLAAVLGFIDTIEKASHASRAEVDQ